MSESKLINLIKQETHHRRLAQAHERKSEYHWNKSNELLLEIIAQAENERELASCELTNSQ